MVLEKGPSSYGAYVPYLPGCVAVGESRTEVTRLIHEAMEFHIEGLLNGGQTVPQPTSQAELIEVSVQWVTIGRLRRPLNFNGRHLVPTESLADADFQQLMMLLLKCLPVVLIAS